MDTTILSHWSALSPFGPTSDEFRAGLESGPACATAVPGFDIRDTLGRSGTRSMDRVTALAVAGIGRLIDRASSDPATALIGPRTAIVLGTTAGSIASTMRFTRDSLTEERPYLVDPARFPNTVMNCAAGRSAIWHHLQGPNATVAGGAVAGLLALNYARRLLATGRADAVVVGAAEELSDERRRIRHRRDPSAAPIAEGAAMLLMRRGSPDGSTAGLELLGPIGNAIVTGDDPAAVVTDECLRTVRRAGVAPAEVRIVATAGHITPNQDFAAAFPGAADRVRPEPQLGDTGAAAGAFALAMLMRRAELPGGGADAPIALVIGYDEGVLATATLRIHHRGRP